MREADGVLGAPEVEDRVPPDVAAEAKAVVQRPTDASVREAVVAVDIAVRTGGRIRQTG